MKCIECKYLTYDDRHFTVECGCSYGSDDGRWNFSVGYLHGNVIKDFLFDEDGCPIDMTVVERHKRCPL
jgi:hypothetical protein